MPARLSVVILLLAIVLIAPFALRRDAEKKNLAGGDAERVVVITPHNESIQSEFGRAFVAHMKREHDREVFVDWRQPGGTSEITRFLKSEFATRFETLWKRETGLPFGRSVREAFADGGLDKAAAEAIEQGRVGDPTLLNPEDSAQLAAAARALFLRSDIGVGIDLFFGGGAYDFNKQAAAGALVARDASGQYGPGALAEHRPDWFGDEVMPEKVSGEPFRDPEFRWVGTVLSAFGICYNTDVLRRLGIEGGLETWSDLADPRLFGQLALADPTKSGSTTKAFEMLIQERIQTLRRERNLPEDEAVPLGWNEAMRLILKISANGRYFTDSSAKVPRDVAFGDAAAGMCIDFYGRTFNELYRQADGKSRIQFVMPRGGTSIGADPIAMLRGAPNPELAHLFIEFVLSQKGQKLWNFRPGTPGGPDRFALRRPPIRRDFYTKENRSLMTDPDVNPYRIAEGFTYRPEWTGSLFSALRFVIRASCIEPHEEQQAAWEALIAGGMPDEGVAAFEAIPGIDYATVVGEIAPALDRRDKVSEVKLARKVAAVYRRHYTEIAEKYGTLR
ncbi:MAG: extracellular solute-binding protein [Verrucomicrobiales bacterium]